MRACSGKVLFASVATVALALGRAAFGSSLVPPENLGVLAAQSQAVVLALAGAPRVAQRGALVFTSYTFRVVSHVAGPLAVGERFEVEVPGGELGDAGWLVPGAPRFRPGAAYLLFLGQRPSGVWQPRLLSYGILRHVDGPSGAALEPIDDALDLETYVPPGGGQIEPIRRYRERALIEHLRAVVVGVVWDPTGVALGPVASGQGIEPSPPSQCKFLDNSRWNVFDGGGSLTMSADATGDGSLKGGGFSELSSALSMWDTVDATSVNVRYGGTMTYTLPCTGDQDVPAFGTNIVVFNDPCSDMADLTGCSGTLAFGGPWYMGAHQFDGSSWNTIRSWFVVVNNGAGCIGSTNYRLMLAHELGHGLGFNHVADSSALMYYMCCNRMDSTDVQCAQYLYPVGEATPTPTPGPPSPPAQVTATDGTFADRVVVTWSAAQGATSYLVFVGSSNDTATALQRSEVSSTSYSDTIATPGVMYYYWVKAKNTFGTSGFSQSDGGYRNSTTVSPTPTRTPTPSPTPTGTPGPPLPPTGVMASDGTFADKVRVIWNSSPGATSYAVKRDTHNTPSSAATIATTTATIADDTSAEPGVVLWYWVTAQNSLGTSALSIPDTGYRAVGSPTPSPTATRTPTAPTPTPTATGTATPPPLAAIFTYSPVNPSAGVEVRFQDASVGAALWLWSFGDGATSSEQSPRHIYANGGVFTVTLVVSNGAATASASRDLVVGGTARRRL